MVTPVKGESNVYLLNVTNRTKYDQLQFDAQKNEIAKQLLLSKKSTYFNQWIQDLKKEADIVDNRYQFYR
ncbi:hypothetical protein C0389_03675 [bacterium]|nr:hypothetical protein [bacterium]